MNMKMMIWTPCTGKYYEYYEYEEDNMDRLYIRNI